MARLINVFQAYRDLTIGEMQMIRYSLLNFFQELRVRVSVFLKTGIQLPSGLFRIPKSLPQGVELPGTIREYGPGGKLLNETTFQSGWEPDNGQVPPLGSNIYSPTETDAPRPSRQIVQEASSMPTEDEAEQEANPVTQAELGLLLHLVGHNPTVSSPPSIDILQDSALGCSEPEELVITVDVTNKASRQLDELFAELHISQEEQELETDDLLQLMDSAE